MTTLVFSLGPVQGFIAQSRRTADGWVGSFLLSYLGCHAARAFAAFGDIEEPHLDSIPLYRAVTEGVQAAGGDLTIAALPNNIVVRLRDGTSPRDAGQAAEDAVNARWGDVVKAIWDVVPPQARGQSAENIWQRQTTNFWETYWGWGADSTQAFRAVAARKGVRNFVQVGEAGERCTLCAEREALWDGPLGAETWRAAGLRYWRNTPPLPGGVPGAVIKPGGRERLCALCLVKRLVPHVRDNPIRKLWQQADVVFPSTSTMATVMAKPALVRAAYGTEADPGIRKAVDEFLAALGSVGRPADPENAFPAWSEALAATPEAVRGNAKKLVRLDGDWLLYGEAVKNEEGLTPEQDQRIRAARRCLIRAASGRVPEAIPPIYWALLVMDGDRMGKLKETLSPLSGAISRELNRFVACVRETVTRRNGRLVYAGGDDVLAFFPVDTVLEAADELRRTFTGVFAQWLATPEVAAQANGVQAPTLSGALIYVHHQTPLGVVVSRGHHLLKHAAKAKAGRNAVAIEIRTRSGPTLTFAQRWEDDQRVSLLERVQAVVNLLNGGDLAESFLYELRRHAGVLGARGPFASSDDRIRYVASLAEKSRKAPASRARDAAQALLALTGPPVHGGDLDVGPLIFARFVKHGGREER